MSKTRTKSSSPEELTTGIRSLRTIGVGVQVARAVTLEARYLTIILDTDNELASRRVGECTNMLRNLLVILAGALSIEVLILPESGK